MNYITQLNAFYDSLAFNPISSSAQLLYLHLLNINNRRNWCKDFTVPNQNIQAVSGLSRQQLDHARNELKQRGYIKYFKGAGSSAGNYLIVCFNTQTDTQADTQNGHKAIHKAGTKRAQTPIAPLIDNINNKLNINEGVCAHTRESDVPKKTFGHMKNVFLSEIDLSGLYTDIWDKQTVDDAIEWYSLYKAGRADIKNAKDGDYAHIRRYAIKHVLEERQKRTPPPNARSPSSQPRSAKPYNTAAPAVGERERRAVEEMAKYRQGLERDTS